MQSRHLWRETVLTFQRRVVSNQYCFASFLSSHAFVVPYFDSMTRPVIFLYLIRLVQSRIVYQFDDFPTISLLSSANTTWHHSSPASHILCTPSCLSSSLCLAFAILSGQFLSCVCYPPFTFTSHLLLLTKGVFHFLCCTLLLLYFCVLFLWITVVNSLIYRFWVTY